MSQKEQLAKLADEQYGNGYYAMAKAVDAAFLMGARAMQERIARGISSECDRHEELPNTPADDLAARDIRALKPEELL